MKPERAQAASPTDRPGSPTGPGTRDERAVSLGRVLATRGVEYRMGDDVLFARGILAGLHRHRLGDWGEVCPEDKRANDAALVDGTRLLSAYTVQGTKVWIITEADRSATTVLFPEEY